ncbi:hypothetical protein ACFFX0_12115 [Citricoccus parietis]|uniref:Uncharacterized protein n=1 Tax=Citricoccus parietis TaxID=592307 RepID=A0ABV5FZ02_9MICC
MLPARRVRPARSAGSGRSRIGDRSRGLVGADVERSWQLGYSSGDWASVGFYRL